MNNSTHNTPDEQRRLLHERGICVIIPTYNNAATLAAVIQDAQRYCSDVLVVNDGSTDGTAGLLARMSGITVVSSDRNRGKGHALREGFRKARQMGFAYAITMDGDGQHYAKDIPAFLEANMRHPGALVVGSRRLEGVRRSRGSAFANRFSNFWFFLQTGRLLSDTQTGYRLYPLRRLCFLGLLPSRYEAEVMLLVVASWHGTRLVETPVDVYYPPPEERVSHFRPAADFARISALNTLLCVLAVVYGWPLRIIRALLSCLRMAYSALVFLLFMVVLLPPAVWIYLHIGHDSEKRRLGLHRLMWKMARLLMLRHGIPGVRFTYETEDPEAFSRPHVVICNHQSHLDIAAQLIFTPRIIFLTNDWAYNNFIYGRLIQHAEYYPVSMGYETLLPRLRDLVRRGYSIAVFPEGTRSMDCRVGRFHQGAFYLSHELGIDILPMTVYGTGKVLPKHGRWLNRGRIHIAVGRPVGREELDAMGGYRQQASAMRKRTRERYESLQNELEKDA